MEKVTVNVNPENKELVIREGEAAKVYDPQRVKIEGNIKAPGEFVKKRPTEINKLKTNVVVDYDNLSISLRVDEENHFSKDITGRLTRFAALVEFGINTTKKYSVLELYNMLRLKRAYFLNREDHAKFLEDLKNFSARTEVEFASTNDFKGNAALQKIQKCKTNLTYNFILNIPLFKGFDPVTFPVEVEFTPTDGSIVC